MNFIVSILFSAVAVTAVAVIPLVGVGFLDLRVLFGVIIPYAAIITFFVGIIVRVIGWGRSPAPFRIPTTAGQQMSLPWIKPNRIDNPSSTMGVIIRMAFEILTFRSLFRNTRMEFRDGPKIGYEWEKWLWLAALAFHYSFLVVVLRHLRFFTDPVPGFVHLLEGLDGLMEAGIAPFSGFGVPGVLISGFVLMGAVTFLFLRRIVMSQMRYISLPADYFPLFLILGIGTTGIMMRYGGMALQYGARFLQYIVNLKLNLLNVDVFTVEIVKVKELAMGLVTLHPTMPEGIGTLFFIHLFLVCVLIAYFPFSKLMHMAGIFLSPTRNLSNNSRFVRHVNPWSYPVKVHTYDEYEDEFREKMVEAGLPVVKMPAAPAEDQAGSAEEKKE
ncbi:sulfate reduction electron transfer complex DsrMKJOP subunit DsrM [Thermodesulfobacteriota bacterium]